jgi:hypothetical protein
MDEGTSSKQQFELKQKKFYHPCPSYNRRGAWLMVSLGLSSEKKAIAECHPLNPLQRRTKKGCSVNR